MGKILSWGNSDNAGKHDNVTTSTYLIIPLHLQFAAAAENWKIDESWNCEEKCNQLGDVRNRGW